MSTPFLIIYVAIECLNLEQGKIDTTSLITHRFALKDIEKAYEIFENKLDGVIKIAVTT